MFFVFVFEFLKIMTQASFDLQTTAGFADFTQFPDGSAASIVSFCFI